MRFLAGAGPAVPAVHGVHAARYPGRRFRQRVSAGRRFRRRVVVHVVHQRVALVHLLHQRVALVHLLHQRVVLVGRFRRRVAVHVLHQRVVPVHPPGRAGAVIRRGFRRRAVAPVALSVRHRWSPFSTACPRCAGWLTG